MCSGLQRSRTEALTCSISFETLEHVADPTAFVAEAARVLTPGGRFICSVPNQWVDETGRDPNPFHLHVFDLPALLALFGSDFHVERVFGQTAGGGMKHHAAPRSLVDVDPSAPAVDPEWWLVVAMRTPLQRTDVPFREPESAHPDAKSWTVTAFEREYDNPWLVRSLVTEGFRGAPRNCCASWPTASAGRLQRRVPMPVRPCASKPTQFSRPARRRRLSSLNVSRPIARGRKAAPTLSAGGYPRVCALQIAPRTGAR